MYGDSFQVIRSTCIPIPISQEQSYMLIIQTQGDGTVAPHWSQGCCSITLSLGNFEMSGFLLWSYHTRYGGVIVIVIVIVIVTS